MSARKRSRASWGARTHDGNSRCPALRWHDHVLPRAHHVHARGCRALPRMSRAGSARDPRGGRSRNQTSLSQLRWRRLLGLAHWQEIQEGHMMTGADLDRHMHHMNLRTWLEQQAAELGTDVQRAAYARGRLSEGELRRLAREELFAPLIRAVKDGE